jgi:hypothetical protein
MSIWIEGQQCMSEKKLHAYDAIEDAFENSVPSFSEIAECVWAELSGSGKTFAYEFEYHDAQDYEDDENEEEDVAGEEYIGDFDASLEADSLDTHDNDRLGRTICCASRAGEEVAEAIQRAFRDLH